MIKSTILVELQESMGNDESIARSAWTSSYDKEKIELKSEQDVNILVPKLIKEGHGTPIESVIFRFWIRLPLFCDRQHMTYRIASHNGLSGRYRTVPDDFYHIPGDVKDILLKACGSSYNTVNEYEDQCIKANEWYREQVGILRLAEKSKHISNSEFKRAREFLRGVLPQSNMLERTTIMNLRSFANYQYQRDKDNVQPETRMIAKLMLEQVEKANICPIAINTLKEIGWKI